LFFTMKLERETVKYLIGAAALTFILYQVDLLYAVFTVPLHVLALKRKDSVVYYAAAVAAFAITIQEFIRFSGYGAGSQDGLIVAIAVFGPVSLFAGTLLYYASENRGLRRLYRFLISLSAAGVLGLLITVLFEGDSAAAVHARDSMREQFSLLMSIGQQSGIGGMFSAEQADMFFNLTVETVKRSFLLGIALQLGVSIQIAMLIFSRLSGKRERWIASFHVPEQFLWPFLVSWTVVLVSLLTDIGPAGVIGWNVALLTGFVYFLQGCAILLVLLQKKGIRISASLIVMLLLLLLLIPGVNALFMLGVPLLGISEIWIQYRVVNKENTDENNS
jgi:hypothetical protein